MKRFFKKICGIRRLKKELRRQLAVLTAALPCVNLSLLYRPSKGFLFYNNSDLIACFTYAQLAQAAALGKPFFCLLLYCLCVKNSIDKY